MKILEELWYGNVRPNDRKTVPESKAAELISLVSRNEQKLLSLLNEEARNAYEKFRDCQAELTCLSECEAFQIGFRIGTKIMQEVMDGVEENFTTEL